MFWVNVPLCLLVIALEPRYLSESKDPDATGGSWLGVAFGTGGCVDHVRHRADGDLGARHPVVGLIVFGFALRPSFAGRGARSR